MKKRKILILALIVALVFTMAACGPQATAPGENGEGGDNIFRFATSGWDGRFTPFTSGQLYDDLVNWLVFDALMENDMEGNPIPLLATWETSEDHHVYTFTIKEGATFSDGMPVTSRDVHFTYHIPAHPDYDGWYTYVIASMYGFDEYRAGEADSIAGITIIDDRTISFRFRDGLAGPANIWKFEFGILPYHHYAFETWDEFLALEGHPVGSGRFIFEEFRPMEFVRLRTNFDHWNPDRIPNIDGILMLEVPPEFLLDAVTQGLVDGAELAATIDSYNMVLAAEGVHYKMFPSNFYQMMSFNTLRPTLEDHRVRQALLYALDRRAFIEILYGPLAELGISPIHPTCWAWTDEGMNPYDFNMERAIELMEEAGWFPGPDGIRVRDGVRMELEWPVYTEVEWPGLISSLAYDSWRQLGVELNIILTDWLTAGHLAWTLPPGYREFCIMAMGFGLVIDPDPTGLIYDFDAFVEGGYSISGFYHTRAQELIRMGRTEFDRDRRIEIYHEWARIQNYYVPALAIAFGNRFYVLGDHVENFHVATWVQWPRKIHELILHR